ncbi:MAG: hypothetical protein J6P81_05575, partial [Spirochaetales bacterium]|nr:hypothetical protein [Spirochaetales bacterium]
MEKEVVKQSRTVQRLPFGPLYFVAARIYANFIGRFQFNLKKSGCKIKGPALILSNHTSNHDY